MLVRPHNRGIDGMFLVGGRPKARQYLEYRIPHPELAPAGEAHEGRIPLAISFGQVAPRRARAQYPENAVHRSPLVRNGRTTLAPIRQQRIENVPFRVRQISPTHGCPPSRKAALNHSPMKKPSTRPNLGVVLPSWPTCCCSPLGFFHLQSPPLVAISLLSVMPGYAEGQIIKHSEWDGNDGRATGRPLPDVVMHAGWSGTTKEPAPPALAGL